MYMKKHLSIVVLTIAVVSLSLINGCKDDTVEETTDERLYDLATESSGFTWYKFDDTLLNSSPSSGHTEPFLRTKYNGLASQHLDSTGKVKSGASFGEGSLIVKELYDGNKDLSTLAVLLKDADHVDADAEGWVWGYLNADGSVREAASNKGTACNNCHAQSGNIDYMLMNKYFP